MSPDLFSLYSEIVLREVEDLHGVLVNGVNINNIRYADDTVLISETETGLQALLDGVVVESERRGLSLNAGKTYVVTVSKRPVPPDCMITANGIRIKQVNKFSYLGSQITSDGKSDNEIKRRIAISKEEFNKKRTVLTNSHISMPTKLRIMRCYIWSILLYGCETWTISGKMQKRLEATEMWYLRRMLKIPWVDRVTNEEVLTRANTKRKLMNSIKSRKMKFLGHVMRRERTECLIVAGKMEGKRARGRQRMTYMDNVKQWTGKSSSNSLLQATRDRKIWKNMVVNASRAQDT